MFDLVINKTYLAGKTIDTRKGNALYCTGLQTGISILPAALPE